MMKRNSSEKIPHGLLLSGGTFEAKQTYIFKQAQTLLCETQNSCGKCRACHWVEKSIHPDLLILPKENEAIKIDEVRSVSRHLTQTSHQGKAKIVILLKADTMPMGATNALLKTLEEPPPNSYLFLISEYPHLLPLTIRSRCQKMIFASTKKSSSEFIAELIHTLKSLRTGKVTCFQAAAKWQPYPLLEVLDGLYYCLLESKAWDKSLFVWQDCLNALRRQLLNKQNPNHLLALEYLFYRWVKLF
jgi:hypothetical protein